MMQPHGLGAVAFGSKHPNQEEDTVNKHWATLTRLAGNDMVRVVWVLLALAGIVLGSGAPLMFGGGSGGGG
jgi:hypothetical protein